MTISKQLKAVASQMRPWFISQRLRALSRADYCHWGREINSRPHCWKLPGLIRSLPMHKGAWSLKLEKENLL